ncbi:MAG TPA: NAD-dependent epimerase/dehydratase family protein [Bryobacteraceae bacterium]
MGNRRIVVTGGAGFIGSHLVDRLAAIEAGTILVLDNLHRPCVDDPQIWPKGVLFAPLDIRNRSEVASALKDCDVVFHLAAQSNVMGAVLNAEFAFDTNVMGTFNVLQAAKAAGAKRLVLTSSREVYGEVENLPVAETAPLRPKNAYGASKVAGELYCGIAAGEGLETVVLRLANVYGPRDRGRVIPLFFEAARAGKSLEIYGGDQVLDFVWIDTVVDALLKAAFGEWIAEPVNIGSGQGVTLRVLADRITEIAGSAAPTRIVPARREEVRRFVADISRARRIWDLPLPGDPLTHLPMLLHQPVSENFRA